MEEIIKTYIVQIVRERGVNPLTGEQTERVEETIRLDAVGRKAAAQTAQLLTTISFRGQIMRLFIDEKEYFDEKY